MHTFVSTLAAVETGHIIETTIDFLSTTGVSFLINVIAALATFVVGKWVAKLLTRIVRTLATKAQIDETLIKFLGNLAYALLMVFVVLASLDQLGVDTTSFAAIIAAAGLAVGFALQG